MRFIWFLTILGLVFTCLLYCICILTGQNILRKYGKNIVTAITSFAVILIILYVTFIVIGLAS